MLEHQHFISEKFGNVEFFLFLFHQRMLYRHKPTHMREKESSLGIVRICVCIIVCVVKFVIPSPHKHAVLIWKWNCLWDYATRSFISVFDVSCMSLKDFISNIFVNFFYLSCHGLKKEENNLHKFNNFESFVSIIMMRAQRDAFKNPKSNPKRWKMNIIVYYDFLIIKSMNDFIK